MAIKFEKFTNKDRFVKSILELPNLFDPRIAKNENYSLIQPKKAPASGVTQNVIYSIYIPSEVLKKTPEIVNNYHVNICRL